MNCPDGDAAFLHGGPDDGGPVRHDFSTNANACGPCPGVLRAVLRADASRYPDPRYTALRERLADAHGVEAGRIVIAGSASEFIFRLSGAVARVGGGSVSLPTHAYGDYARAAQAWGLAATDARASVGVPPALAWFCDPSSPLGQASPALDDRVAALAPSTVAVLDLAYEPLRLDGRLDLAPSQRDRVWQLRTPNKALGLTGVRAAFAIAPCHGPDLLGLVQRMAPSWAAGAHGVAMLEGWTDASTRRWLAASHERLRKWRDRQRSLCATLGWRVEPTVANFFCADLGVETAPAVIARLRAQGIKLRDTASFGLPGRVRLGVLAPKSQDALRDAWLSPGVPGRAAAPASCSRLPS